MRALFIAFVVSGCGGAQAPSAIDAGADLWVPPDDAAPAAPAPAPVPSACVGQPMTDGQPCVSGCGAGSMCAGYDTSSLRCYQVCDPKAPACACGRRCTPITKPDGSIAAACLPANGAGERCGVDPMTSKPYGWGSCAQGLSCAGSGPGSRYCVYQCESSGDCPAQTACTAVVSGTMIAGTVCWYNSQPEGLPAGTACGLTDLCISGTLCDGTCQGMCAGPGDPACGAGKTCTALASGMQTIGYVCR